MKISNSLFKSVYELVSKTKKNSIIPEECLSEVGNFVENKSMQGSTTTLPVFRRVAKAPFSAIKYHKAQNIEEAQEYAQKALGIKSYEINDLELSNQVNLSMTRAYNKTRGKLNLPEQVVYQDISSSGTKFESKDIPMQMDSYFPSNEAKCTENMLEINKTYFDNLDNKINQYIDAFAKKGQLSKNANGLDTIELISQYKYDHTLNRYYRLYKQGKLTTKSKADFENLLQAAVEKEKSLLLNKDSLIEYLQKKLGVNLENLQKEEFTKEATANLLKLRRQQKLLLVDDIIQTKNAIGVDGQVLHELGHSWHAKNITGADYDKYSQHFEDINELKTAFKISPYASTNKREGIGELVKGILSGDIYSDDIMQFGNECTNGKLSLLI